MLLLARELARTGMRVAHVVFPVEDPRPLPAPAPTIVERPPYPGHGPVLDAAVEAAAIWRGLRRADAHCYVVRGSGGHLAVAAKFCRMHRRRLVFSSSNDVDFNFQRPDRRRHVMRSYRKGIARADRIVVQTSDQLELARQAFPAVESIVIPSFAEPAEPAGDHPEVFLWTDRLVPYKRPEALIDLAEALPDARFLMVPLETDETHWYPELAERVHRRAERLPNLDLVQTLPRERLLDELSRTVAVVKTSEVEGMPNTFLEAWARGVPVLSLSVDPGRRIAEHDIGIVAGDSLERLVAAADELWRDGRRRAEMGERARRYVSEVHSPAAVAARWRAVLDRLLQ
jgi:glycosyltransferase involved in cell wall biosynthesis